MSIFELDPQGQRAVEEEALINGLSLDDTAPTFFENTGTGIAKGVMRGGARVGQLLGMAATAPIVLIDKAADTKVSDTAFKAIDNTINSAVDYWTPAANEVGTAGRVLGGLSEITLPLMAGVGNPALLIGAQELGTATDLTRQGADAKAAVGVGVAQGLATAVGFKIPFLGKTALRKMASGAGGNLAVNTATSAISEQVLKATGDDASAEQFDPFNAEARMVDVLTGLAFGGLAHVSVRNAAIAANNAKHFQQDTAPGIPADQVSSVAHQNAMEVATKALLEGEPVTARIDDAEFLKRPTEALAPETQSAIDEYDLETTAELPVLELPDSDPTTEIQAKPVAAEITDPLLASAHAIAEQTDHQIPIANDDGSVTMMSAKDYLSKSGEAMKQAETDARGYLAAATCFMQVGQ